MNVQLTWDVTLEDYRVFLAKFKTVSTADKVVLYLIYASALGLLLYAAYDLATGQWKTASVKVSAVIGGFVGAKVCSWLTGRMYYYRQRLQGLQIDMTADDAGVIAKTKASEVKISWSGIWRVDALDEHTLLWTDKVHAMILPHRAFESKKQAHDFTQFALAQTSGNTF